MHNAATLSGRLSGASTEIRIQAHTVSNLRLTPEWLCAVIADGEFGADVTTELNWEGKTVIVATMAVLTAADGDELACEFVDHLVRARIGFDGAEYRLPLGSLHVSTILVDAAYDACVAALPAKLAQEQVDARAWAAARRR